MSGVGWDNIPIINKGPNKEWYYAGNTLPVERLGIPSFNFADAAGGFRDQWYADAGTSTAWPSLLSAAASFSPENVKDLGVALAEEFSAKGANFIWFVVSFLSHQTHFNIPTHTHTPFQQSEDHQSTCIVLQETEETLNI